MRYIYELPDWPQFTWRPDSIVPLAAAVRLKQGRLIGQMEALGFPQRDSSMVETLTKDVVKSSAIEGESLDDAQVRSSVARRLGVHVAGLVPSGRKVEGVVEMVLEATQHYDRPLTNERLFAWHKSLFSTEEGSGARRIGAWRDDAGGPMVVASGGVGRERIHYEAPAAARVSGEMARFIAWANEANGDPLVRSALAHLWFVTIHPFDDGNGRIARAIADWALARSESSSRRFYSMSAQIQRERKDYYETLESTQKASLDVTDWMVWFLRCLDRAIEGAQVSLDSVLRKDRFWKSNAHVLFNERQRSLLNRILDGSFEGKLTSSKWAKLTKCSQDTAHRDIVALVDAGILLKDPAGGRSTSYSLRPC